MLYGFTSPNRRLCARFEARHVANIHGEGSEKRVEAAPHVATTVAYVYSCYIRQKDNQSQAITLLWMPAVVRLQGTTTGCVLEFDLLQSPERPKKFPGKYPML